MKEKKMKLNITILYGSYREGRLGIRAVKFLERLLKERQHNVTFIDAKEINLPMLDKRYIDYEPGTAPKALEDLRTLFEENTDVFVIVSGEYNSTLQPGLKNLLDHFFKEYFYRPSAMVTYSIGSFGGIRAASDLRKTLGIYGMPAIPAHLMFPAINEALDENGHSPDGKAEKRAEKFINELEWFGRALKREREENGLPS
jgi:NAD(P)H-dependent FMN reductase